MLLIIMLIIQYCGVVVYFLWMYISLFSVVMVVSVIVMFLSYSWPANLDKYT